MKPGSVFVDIAIDQGGCAESSRPTTHDDPVYLNEGVLHYCVTNMPGAYARTATLALTNATMPYALNLANLGLHTAMELMPDLRLGLNTYRGEVVCAAVAQALGLNYSSNPFVPTQCQ
jgi:alanine dehydrogenase